MFSCLWPPALGREPEIQLSDKCSILFLFAYQYGLKIVIMK